MSIRVLFFASLADIAGGRERRVDSAEVTDVLSVFNKFAAEFPDMEEHRASILFALNSEFARLDAPVRNGDEIAFLPPVSGG
jgi:molybdopterin synthase sulfur carrier subunit